MLGWDIFVRYIPLPSSVEGVTIPCEDGTFCVYINVNLCQDKKQFTLEHELRHIRKDHFYNCDPVIYNELEAAI